MKNRKLKIRKEKNKTYKHDFVEKVLRDLPDWFGIEDSIIQYADNSKENDTFIISVDGEDLGFLTIKETSNHAIDLYCLGILSKYRNTGLGTTLVREVLDLYKNNFSLAHVKTLDEGVDEFYDQTIRFYKSLGFMKLETIKEIWGEENPCQIMVKSL